jgi:hypothetical protein
MKDMPSNKGGYETWRLKGLEIRRSDEAQIVVGGTRRVDAESHCIASKIRATRARILESRVVVQPFDIASMKFLKTLAPSAMHLLSTEMPVSVSPIRKERVAIIPPASTAPVM